MFQNFEWRSRTKAAAIHLGLSALVALLASALVFGVWFPSPYGAVSGGLKLFLLLVSVDAVLGPLLTWLVFDRRKPRAELFRDLAVVLTLQLSGLVYGLWSMYQARPVYVVHEVDRLVVISAADVDPADLVKASPAFRQLPFSGVRLIGLRDHRDRDERTQAFELALAGKDLSVRPEYWQALSELNQKVMRQRSKPIQTLSDRSLDDRHLVEHWLSQQGKAASEVRYMPLVGRNQYWTVLLDGKTLAVLGYLPIDGF